MIIFLILLLAAALRLYNLPASFVFAGDEEYQTILAMSQVVDFHIIWVGVNAGHTGFYLGPYWTYFTAFWLWLSKGDPLITGYIASLIGVLTTWLVILTGSTLFGKAVGRMAGLLYASLPLVVFLDQKYWNPTLTPLLSLLMLLSLYKAKTNQLWLILFAAAFGLIFHTHLSLFPIIFVAIFWFFQQKIKPSGQVVFLSLIVFLIAVAPLIAFDWFHKGSNLTTLQRFSQISQDPVNKIKPFYHFKALFQTLGRIWYIKPPSVNADEVIISCTTASRTNHPAITDIISKRFTPPFFLSLIGLFVLLSFLLKRQTWKSKQSMLLGLFFTSIMVAFLFFPGGSYEYYLLGIFPLMMFLPGILILYYQRLKLTIYATVLLLSILGIYTVATNRPEFGLAVKKDLIGKVINFIGGSPFELKQKGLCHFYEGWRYLFSLSGAKPERSDSDTGLGWLYPSEITQKAVKYTVIMSEKRAPIDFDAKKAQIISSGGFDAYIFTNPIWKMD